MDQRSPVWNRLLLLTPCDIMNKLLQQFIQQSPDSLCFVVALRVFEHN